MPTLNWIGKDAVINHHQEVPFRTLEKQYDFGDVSENKIIHGDNLEALKALLPYYEGKIKCIYIDPPYNTGNENWVYNDNVNSPKIRKWLGQVVGKESEDLTRHDKWLCMMYPRLQLLRQLLAEDGAIFISIDDNEQANLKLICDEIFGAGNFVAEMVWEQGRKSMSAQIAVNHEYCIVYCKNRNVCISFNNETGKCLWKERKKGLNTIYTEYNKLKKKYKEDYETISLQIREFYKYLPDDNPAKAHKHYNYVDEKGLYFAGDISQGTGNGGRFEILHPKTNRPVCIPKGGWRFGIAKLPELLKENRIHFGVDETSIPCLKRYLKETEHEIASSVFYKDGRGASLRLKEIFSSNVFDYPKDETIIAKLIQFIYPKGIDGIILDSFAGSGTTAHAVLKLNKQDGGSRKFILVEMEDYAETITAERVRRVINGYGEGNNAVEGTGGGFSYYELGEPIFDGEYLNENQPTERLREYVFYTETRQPLCRDAKICVSTGNNYFLGTHNETDYYFYYEKEQITTLTRDTLNIVRQKAETYVIYADQCFIDEKELAELHIIFKKIPRDIRRF